jgi:uncharacterized membrane protein YkvA (DUF1232 family)
VTSPYWSAIHVRGILSILLRLPQYLRLCWRLMWDASDPLLSKLLLVAVLAYGIYPFDLLPEGLLPHLGFGEDLLLFVLAVRHLIKSSPQDTVKKHAAAIAAGKPTPREP